MVHLMSKYLLASAMVGSCSVVFILRAIKTTKDRRDSNRIYQFLCRSVKDGQYRFRSSEAISAVTNLPVSRIADLCRKHGRIERKEQQRHMWRVGSSAESSGTVIRVYDEAGNVVETDGQAGQFKEP
jgi:hypothetical protein